MTKPAPPDQAQRRQALDPGSSILVQAPAGSGKTDLLTRRFLRLLAEVDHPGQVVAITFTRAAAAEMRHRILSELERAGTSDASAEPDDPYSMSALARRALHHSQRLDWHLLDLPAQLRISTIDSFCRELALQQPLLTELGGQLDISDQPTELYRRAARLALEKIDSGNAQLTAAIESLLLWRDNNWQDLEDQLVLMLAQRDRWMHDFVLDRDPDWTALRERLERPFAQAVRETLARLDPLFDQVPNAREEALALARFACLQTRGAVCKSLAEQPKFPASSASNESLEDARHALVDLADLLLTGTGTFRKQINKSQGFPTDRKAEKARILNLIQSLGAVSALESTLAAVRDLPPARYTEEDWKIVQSCFILLRQAAAELRTVFAETGAVDYTEVSQIAARVLRDADGQPTDAALALADGIRHLLVDEFQDTSRRQHRLLASLVAAWPDSGGRTLFVVGDPMQSIYFFRDADAELFPRVQTIGLELPDSEPHTFTPVRLSANFRTEPGLVTQLNTDFTQVFAANDGSGVTFASAEPARDSANGLHPPRVLHLDFIPQTDRSRSTDSAALQRKATIASQREATRDAQTTRIVELIRSHMLRIDQARAAGAKYRIAVLGRARTALAPIAQALRESDIPFRAVELEQLRDRPEILDALALARALLNPQDRVSWLGVLRAPWCGLVLADLHQLAGADDPESLRQPIPALLAARLHLLSSEGQHAAQRILRAFDSVPALRAAQPTAALGTWLQQVWLSLGGAACVDATARVNLDLLWTCLDHLPGGEQDILSPALDTALQNLTAQPDPAAEADCGVQLMTIHKSKGLEFEVVIVPELQAGGGRSTGKLLSWLERGLPQPDGSGDITEFLIAPLQPRGTDRGSAKAWVDRVYRERESQEMRRILYVAATRARQELHLFARPEFRLEDGAPILIEPKSCLLATAWPALAAEVHTRFNDWAASAQPATEDPLEGELRDLVAGASNILVMPLPITPTSLRRLPADYNPPLDRLPAASAEESPIGMGAARLYERHEGGLLSRALGSAVHKLLEELSRLRLQQEWPAARSALAQFAPRIAADVRSSGIHPAPAQSLASRALSIALSASNDAHGQWILSPHPEAASEAAWAGVVSGSLRTVRVDRLFRAGLDPLSAGDNAWWVIDYKTAHDDDLDPAEALPRFRALFAPQLETYAAVLRNLHPGAQLRAALYYPRMLLFDWWEL
jgi:ATP-dependent exoDNAse (exonuclease V) beta subunit